MMPFAIPFPELSPTLFEIQLGPLNLALRYYALAYIVGILLGWQLFAAALRRPALWPNATAPMTKEQLDDLLTWMILAIIIGGRLGYTLVYNTEYYLANPVEIPQVWQGGMAFHGGFAGVVVAGLAFCWRNRLPVLQVADGLALAAPAGILLGRIANFINAELWGRPTDLPWGVIFPGVAAQDCPGIDGLCARHPSQLYEAGLEGLVLGLVLIWLAFGRGWLRRPGSLLGVFLIGYGAARMFVELFRQADAQFITAANPSGAVFAGLSMGQLLSLPMVLAGIAILIWALRRTPRPA